jgi:MFS family permease
MNHSWSKTVFPIAAIFSFRMLGLFLLIPVFTIYAADLQGATPALIGFALGGYGLTQGLCQIPFGMLSDKFGRKPMITIGLILFALGSLLGAMSESIYGIIAARTLQGTGAVGSVLIALLADLTPDEERTKAMAVIGMTIGTSFSLAMVISPALSARYGLAGIFYLTTCLSILGIILIQRVIPSPHKERFHADSQTNPALFKSVITDTQLLRLNGGIFCQHFILTATFFVIPIILSEQLKQGHLTQQWHFYLPLMVCAFLTMIPLIILGEKKKKMRPIFISAVLVTGLAQLLLAFNYQDWYSLCLLMFLYFIVFNFLEASLPSLISKRASPKNKGTAMGVYSTGQFLGIFAGGSLAGVLYQWQSCKAIFSANAILSLIWFVASLTMKINNTLSTLIFSYSVNEDNDNTLSTRLLALAGVKEVIVSQEEQTIYLRVNKGHYQKGSAEELIHPH